MKWSEKITIKLFTTFLPGLGRSRSEVRDPYGPRPKLRQRPGGPRPGTETQDLTAGLETGLETETRNLQHCMLLCLLALIIHSHSQNNRRKV